MNSVFVSDLTNYKQLYPLLYTPSRDLQRTAFTILHKTIPTLQDQISFDAALENKAAQLPEELLSLVLEPPTIDSLADASFRIGMPLDLQGYLLSWQLVFDHFQGSSYKVKSDYIENLKEGDYLAGLLDLTYSLLGHVRGRAVDVSKFDVTRYDYTEQEDDLSENDITPERRMQWLLAHLYFLCLSHLPSLTKAHYLNLTSRQTSLAVETWTAKFIAPRVINASLSSVANWASTEAKDDPDSENLTVRVAMRTREVNVSYLVDEQTMAIVVRLPETYPLTGARVEGVNRVAVDEKKWQSWLRSCQGVITFSVRCLSEHTQPEYANMHDRTVTSSMVSPRGARMLVVLSRARLSALSATASSVVISSFRTNVAARARICSTALASSSGSRRVMPAPVRCAGTPSTMVDSGVLCAQESRIGSCQRYHGHCKQYTTNQNMAVRSSSLSNSISRHIPHHPISM